MKKRIILILTIVISLIMTSCTTEAGIKEPEQTNGELNLFVTTIQEIPDNGFKYAIEQFEKLYPDIKLTLDMATSSSGKESRQELATKIMSGNAPDIIFVDDAFTKRTDIYKLMNNNYFTDLTPYLEADSDYKKEEYNQGIIKGGNIDGKQYLMPLVYGVPVMFYDKILLEEKEVNLNDKNFAMLLEELTKLNKKDNNIQLVNEYLSFGEYPFHWYSSFSGIKQFDYNNKTFEFKEKTKDIADMTKTLFSNFEKNTKDSYGALEKMKNKDLLLVSKLNIHMTGSMFADSAMINKFSEPSFEFIKDINDEMAGSIINAVGIYNGSSNKQNAYNFIKILMDDTSQYDTQMQFGLTSMLNLPIKNTKVKDLYKYYSTLGASPLPRKPLDQEFYDRFYDESQKITDATMVTPWDLKYYEIMLPYFKGEKTYEECFELVKAQAKIYISE